MLRFSIRALTLALATSVVAACSGGNVTPGTSSAMPSQQHVRPNTVQEYPTDKSQCMDGGWKKYGLFKNQGDCISYVENGK
jgi:hypothetical protein